MKIFGATHFVVALWKRIGKRGWKCKKERKKDRKKERQIGGERERN